MNIFEILLVQPFMNILVLIYNQLIALHIPNALGFSIILLTIVVRFALYPFMQQSLTQQKKMMAINPKLNKIKEKYKNDVKAQQMAQIALFKEEGINPASGCFLLILQIPILIALYQVLIKVISDKSINDINRYIYSDSFKLKELWDFHFFGLSVAVKPQDLMAQSLFLAVGIAVLTGALQLIQSKMMSPKKADKPKQQPGKEPDFASTLQTQMLYLLPVMVGFFAFTLPFGLSLYWNTLTIFGIIQQYIVQGWGGLVDWAPFLAKKQESKYK